MIIVIGIFFLIFLWGNIWCVPAVIAGKRRKRNTQVYLFIFSAVLALELAIAIGLLLFANLIGQSEVGLYVSPAIASIIGGILYWSLAENKDRKIANPKTN